MPALRHAAAYSGKRLDALVMDAPIWHHAPKLVLWCVLEALALTLGVWITRECPQCFLDSHNASCYCCTLTGLLAQVGVL